jgi:hypothetical protein
VVLAEIAERKAVQVAAVGGIAKRAEVGVVRRLDAHRAARPHQAVELFHGADDVRHVFDHVDGQQPVEGVIRKRIGKVVQIAKHVGAAGGIPIDTDGSGLLMNPAADVQDSRFGRKWPGRALLQSIQRTSA